MKAIPHLRVLSRPTALLAVVLLGSVMPALSQDETGDEKNLFMGVVSKIDGDTLIAKNPTKVNEERKIHLTKDTKVSFVGFKGIGQTADKPAVGFAMRANLGKDDAATAIVFTPDFPPLKKIADKHKLTPEGLFRVADLNKDGKVD